MSRVPQRLWEMWPWDLKPQAKLEGKWDGGDTDTAGA